MSILGLRDASLAFGVEPLLAGVTLHIDDGDRICLLGRNGAGKSTLLRVLAGDVTLDSGFVEASSELRIALLAQEVPPGRGGSIREVIAEGLREGEGTADHTLDHVLSRLSLDGDAPFAPLSAGNKRRVYLGRALAARPDVLLMDEPTNHLDVSAIEWLEDFAARFEGALVFVTHDRAFLERVATRILELDRGNLYDFPGSYAQYLRRREAALADEARHAAAEDKKLAKEEAWLRQGIKARRTRNEGRKRALLKMRDQRKARREQVGQVRMQIQEAGRSGKLVIEAEHLTVGYGGEPVVDDLSTLVLRGDRLGIVGPNGCGKTTLVRALLGELELVRGQVRLGTKLEVAYFDQLREQLDDEATPRSTIGDGADTVVVGGQPRHVLGYLGDWLFAAERAQTPIGALSGGERNRLLLARLFLRPSNLLVLDEPTNDLDMETLELLEERLVDFGGTVLVVSHDRAFLDNVATSILAWEGPGRFVEYAGGYSDHLVQKRAGEQPPEATAGAKARGKKPKTSASRKLSFKEQRELDELPERLEALENEQTAIHETLADPALYQQGADAVVAAQARLAGVEQELAAAYARWEELEEIARAATAS